MPTESRKQLSDAGWGGLSMSGKNRLPDLVGLPWVEMVIREERNDEATVAVGPTGGGCGGGCNLELDGSRGSPFSLIRSDKKRHLGTVEISTVPTGDMGNAKVNIGYLHPVRKYILQCLKNLKKCA